MSSALHQYMASIIRLQPAVLSGVRVRGYSIPCNEPPIDLSSF